MIRDGFEVTKTLDSEKEGVQTEVHYLKKLHNRIECLDCIGAPLLLLAALLSPEDDEYGDLPPEAAEERKGPDESSEGSRTHSEMKADIKKLKDGTTEDAPQSDVKAMQRPPVAGNAGNAGRLSVRKPDHCCQGQGREGTCHKTRQNKGQQQGLEEDETGAARRQKDDKRGTLKRGDRKAQFNKIFTTTMQRRLRTATDRSAAMLFKKPHDRSGDLQSFLKLTLSKHGIKTMHRIQSAKEQQERWNDEVDYMTTKLRRGAGMESMWRERHDAWLQEMKDTFGDMVLDAFVQADRLQQILRETFEQMKEELPTAEVDDAWQSGTRSCCRGGGMGWRKGGLRGRNAACRLNTTCLPFYIA
eukprot:g7349.t1